MVTVNVRVYEFEHSHYRILNMSDQEVFLSEQTDFLQDIPANTDIFLAFKT
jgi:hypothetical protein